MNKITISFLVLVLVIAGVVALGSVVRAQPVPSTLSGSDPADIGSVIRRLFGLSQQNAGPFYTPPPATPAEQLPAGYQVTPGNAGDFTTLTGVIINGNHGDVNDVNFLVRYPGGGTLTGTEMAGLKHWNGFWSALWARAGGGPNSANRAIYADGPVTIMNGNVGIGIESPYSQDKLHVAGNIRADDTIVASKGLCVGGGGTVGEFSCTNDGNMSGAWCGIQHLAGHIPVNSFPCKGVAFPGCPAGYAYTAVGFNAYNIPNVFTCMKTGTGY